MLGRHCASGDDRCSVRDWPAQSACWTGAVRRAEGASAVCWPERPHC